MADENTPLRDDRPIRSKYSSTGGYTFVYLLEFLVNPFAAEEDGRLFGVSELKADPGEVNLWRAQGSEVV